MNNPPADGVSTTRILGMSGQAFQDLIINGFFLIAVKVIHVLRELTHFRALEAFVFVNSTGILDMRGIRVMRSRSFTPVSRLTLNWPCQPCGAAHARGRGVQ